MKDTLISPDDSDVGYSIQSDLSYPDIMKEKTRNYPFSPGKNISPQDKFTDSLRKWKPNTYTRNRKLICDWTDKKNILIHFRMLNFWRRPGMVLDKTHEMIYFKQNKWLKNYIGFNTQKRNEKTNAF